VTSSPSDTETAPDPLQEFANEMAEAVGGEAVVDFETIKIRVPAPSWVDTLTRARDRGMVYFSWLSAVDWSSDPQVGDPLTEEVEDRIELLAMVGDLGEGKKVIFSTDLDPKSPSIESLVAVYAGANWHEREAAEMFGIDFEGHPDLSHLYLPDAFIGHPLRKSFPLLSREVKPWPGSVDVEALPGSGDDAEASDDAPSEENPEA
jgi:NADH-quinone oxidoreductase subunit C